MATSKLFDKMKGVAGSDSEKAVIEATLHTAREPPPEKYVRRASHYRSHRLFVSFMHASREAHPLCALITYPLS